MVVVVKQVRTGHVTQTQKKTPPKLKLFLKPKLRRGRGSSSFNRQVREEQARIEKANVQLRSLGLPIERFAGESSALLNQRIAQENARRQVETQRLQAEARRQASIERKLAETQRRVKAIKKRQIRQTITERRQLTPIQRTKTTKKDKKEKALDKLTPKEIKLLLSKAEKKAKELLFERALGTSGPGTGLKIKPEFSSGEKFSLRTAGIYAGVKFDKALRRSKKYKKFSDDIDRKVEKNKFSKFSKDNILQPIAEDAFLLAATSPFLKSSTALKNEFLLDEIAKLNRASTREISLGLKKVGKGKADEILLASTKTSKNFKIQTLTNYKVKTVNGKTVIAEEGRGATKLINKRTGKAIGKPVEFTFFGKGKAVEGRFIQVGKEGDKLIKGLGKAKASKGQVKILTDDLKVIKSRFGSLFKNQKNVELSLTGKVDKIPRSKLRFKDIKVEGVRQAKITPSLKNLLRKAGKKAELLGTKKTVRLNIDDLAVIRKLAPRSYSKIIRGEGTRISGSGKNVQVSVQQKDLGKKFGQVVSKEVEKVLSGKVTKGIQKSKSIDRLLKNTVGKGLSKVTRRTTTTTTVTTVSAKEKGSRSATKDKTKKKQDVSSRSRTKVALQQAKKAKQKLRLKLKLKLKKITIRPRIKLRIKPKIAKQILLLKGKKLKGKRIIIKKKGKKGFDVFAKPVKGKNLIKINQKTLSRTDAKDLRNFIIDTSLSRQGSVRPAKGKPKKPRIRVPRGFAKKTSFKFRRFKTKKKKRIQLPKGRVIERKTRLLDTRQERRGISLRRRLKQLSPKKKIVKRKVVKRVVKKKINGARRRQLLANLKRARMAKARLAAQRRTTAGTQLTARRRVISIV